MGLIVFLLSLPWFSLAILPYILPEFIPMAVCIMIGVVWAAAAFVLIRYWSSSSSWNEAHRMALVFGALLASMLAGFMINGPILSPLDLAGKTCLDLLTLLLLARLAIKIQRQAVLPA
jgi:hypothetical protein